jgi:hypothetical protein
MEDLKALFEVRDEQYSKETTKIFKLINNTVTCVTAYLCDMDERVAQGIVKWEDVSIIEDMLVVIGSVNYEVGTTITLDGKEYQIREDNIDEFQSVAHMSIPLDMAIDDDEDEIMAYLYDIGMDSNIEDFTSVLTPHHDSIESEFDLSELSEEQIQALKLSTAKGGH